jgi:hypothetical protein
MDQNDAGRVSREVAGLLEVIVRAGAEEPLDAEEAGQLESLSERVRDVVFEQAREFIPDSALVAVAKLVASDSDIEAPFVVAVAGHYVYVIQPVWKDFEDEVESSCHLAFVSPERTSVTARTKYWERVTSSSPARKTLWTFELPGLLLTFESKQNPESDIDPKERVAQTIASLAGWDQLPLGSDRD